MEISCAFCMLSNQPLETVSYELIMEAYSHITALFKKKNSLGNVFIVLTYSMCGRVKIRPDSCVQILEYHEKGISCIITVEVYPSDTLITPAQNDNH